MTMTNAADHAHHQWHLVELASRLTLWILLLHPELLMVTSQIALANFSHMFLRITRAIPHLHLDPLEGFQPDLLATHRRQDLLGHHLLLDPQDLHHPVAQDRLTM